jgi:hypothetical protein
VVIIRRLKFPNNSIFLFKEMKMKKNLLLTGLVSVLLLAGMMFTACGGDDGGDDGLSAPGAGDLPALPSDTGIAYVSTETEAKTLLNGLGAGLTLLRGAVEDLVMENGTESEGNNSYTYSWNVKDDTSITNLKVNATGRMVERWSDSGGEIPKAGDYQETSENSTTAIEFTGNMSGGGGIIYQGSSIAEETALSGKMTIKTINQSAMTGTVNVNGSMDVSHAYGLTVSSSAGKGGKIILDARVEASLNKDITVSFEDGFDGPEITPKFSGSLKVYGESNDTPVYTLNIVNEDDYEEALGYFGIEINYSW